MLPAAPTPAPAPAPAVAALIPSLRNIPLPEDYFDGLIDYVRRNLCECGSALVSRARTIPFTDHPFLVDGSTLAPRSGLLSFQSIGQWGYAYCRHLNNWMQALTALRRQATKIQWKPCVSHNELKLFRLLKARHVSLFLRA